MSSFANKFFDYREKILSSDFSCEFFYEDDIVKLCTMINTLETMHYFYGASPELIRHHKANSFKAHTPINNIFCVPSERIRTINLDSEEIFEEGCVEVMNDFLSLPLFSGQCLPSISDWTDSDLVYHVSIGELHYCLWQYKKTEHTSEDWYIAFARTIMLMNDILHKRGYSDKVYFEYGDNDSNAVILTKEMFQYLVKNNIIHNQPVTLQ